MYTYKDKDDSISTILTIMEIDMQNKFEIITDSTANLPETMIDEFDIHVLPLSFIVDEVEYKGYEKGVETDLSQFYSMMREKKLITKIGRASCRERVLRLV